MCRAGALSWLAQDRLVSAINISFQGVLALLSQSAKCIALFLLQKTQFTYENNWTQ